MAYVRRGGFEFRKILVNKRNYLGRNNTAHNVLLSKIGDPQGRSTWDGATHENCFELGGLCALFLDALQHLIDRGRRESDALRDLRLRDATSCKLDRNEVL